MIPVPLDSCMAFKKLLNLSVSVSSPWDVSRCTTAQGELRGVHVELRIAPATGSALWTVALMVVVMFSS